MAFQLSPGVNVSEVDLTTVVPAVATSVGGIVGNFAWGPVDEITTISNENQLADRFGKPNSNNFQYFFTAANFLSYSNSLRVIRSVNQSTAKNAVNDGSTGVIVLNETNYLSYIANTATSFVAKYPGALGNSLKVSMCDSDGFSSWSYASQFDSIPATSSYADGNGSANDEIHIVVVDEDGAISGVAGTLIEKYGFVSKASDAKNADGSSNYYKDVLNNKSKWIWWGGHDSSVSNWGNASTGAVDFDNLTGNTTVSLAGGVDGTTLSSNVVSSQALFSNPDSVDVSLIMSGPGTSTEVNNLISVAESRKDCIVFCSPESADVVDNFGSESTDVIAAAGNFTKSSYAVMDCNWKYQFDKYNNVYRWVPLNGDIAGLCARTDAQRDPWFSPAGVSRGVIKNVVKLAWNPTQSERDDLYKAGINPVVTFPGEGTILYGDKTLQNRPSAFDRINVRRLFIVLEKSIAKAARSSLFEFNDEFTRAAFVNLVEPFLRDVKGRRGIYDFRVVCDTTNNTSEVIDANRFVGDIYIKPARSINFIQLNFVAVRTGVAFEEIVGSF